MAQTDADAVFGMIYAQAEDDFNPGRDELPGRVSAGEAEAEGESAIWRICASDCSSIRGAASGLCPQSPWLKALMQAWADGLNYFLATHPDVHPRVLTHFEPWMALSFHRGQHRRRHRARPAHPSCRPSMEAPGARR